MRRKRPMKKAVLPKAVPATSLPVDCTGNQTVSCPMDANDTLGICGPAMCDHVDGIRTYGQGQAGFAEIHANLAALVAQYEQVSGGDNGTDEDMLVGTNGIWMTGLANDPTAVVVDHLDVDITDVALAQYCMDQFYHVNMAWSVPDDFIQKFTTGVVFADADTPNPNNGHFTTNADVGGPTTLSSAGESLNGFMSLWTWGSFCWVSPAFVASVDPECFVTFSPLQFNKASGYDSHGRHVSDQAAKWVALGGNASLVNAVVAQFPPKTAPPAPPTPPTPPAPPTPPTPPAPPAPPVAAPTLAQVVAAITPLWPAASSAKSAKP
jgi:hypothetical protein